jgi:hypothetical protein
MNAIDYGAMAAMTESTIAANGRAITLVKSGSTPVSSGEPWKGVSNPITVASPGGAISGIFGLFLDYTEKEIDGTTIKRGDQKCLVAALGIADVTQYGGVKDSGSTWSIVKASLLQPGPTRLLFEFQLRQ